jgi:peptide subunit release factor 1 (eRF1)
MISLIIPPRDQISRVSKMLADEFGTASNIKSRVNRLSVLGAITSVQHRLKLYTKGDSIEINPATRFCINMSNDEIVFISKSVIPDFGYLTLVHLQ